MFLLLLPIDGHGMAMMSGAAKWTAVCSLECITDQNIICVQVAGVDLILVRDADTIYACERACPHEQADLSLGHVADGRLFCPRHFASFGFDNGEISPGWLSRALRRYPVRIEDAQVWIDAAAVKLHS